MGRTVYAEERLLNYLETLGKPDAYSVGLIFGQSSDQKDYVVHLARIPFVPAADAVEDSFHSHPTNPEDNYIKSIKDLDVFYVADHAKTVTRMLPGGIWVLGMFVVGPEDCLTDNSLSQKLKSAVMAIHKSLDSNVHLSGNSPHEKLILSFNTLTKKYISKSIDTAADGFLKPADWRFAKKPTKWYHFETIVDLNTLCPIFEEENLLSLKKQLQIVIRKYAEMINKAVIVIEGEAVTNSSNPLESIMEDDKTKKNKQEEDENDKLLQVGVYIPYWPVGKQEDIKSTICEASIKVMGQLVSRVSLHEKSTCEEAANAVKQDILRSIASRLELHWDTIIVEENGFQEENVTLHEPPRRIFLQLPQNRISLSDYLYPGEVDESMIIDLFKTLLDLEISENQLQKDLEKQIDPTDLYKQNKVSNENWNAAETETKVESDKSWNIIIYVSALLTVICAIILGILLYFFQKKN
ncbi:hypothetical protein TKK_0002033 [Trichogramma kaykai]|uniref:Protein odr-4 homolog n=1 Tax=Trichogramma kaykai TaxID=54128 RepID=A0ABD2X7Z3_9HYME